MKKILFPIAIVAALFVAGCAKENLVEPMGPQNGVTILTAGTPTTKTVLQNDQKVLWTNGDQINVNGVESEALVLDTPAATATFTIPGVLNNPFKAVFPASIYKDAQTVNLPAVQAYAEESFGPNVSPMAAYQANGNNLNFKHLAAVIKLNITKGSDADEIMYVEFCGKNNEQVCGDFSIDFENATLAGVSTKASDKKVRCNIYEEISSAGLSVYVAVPALEYQNGYTVKVVDTKGHFMEISKQSGETLVAGKIYDMPAFEFAPTGTEFNVGITSATEFVEFAQNYNNGEYDKNVKVALVNDIVFDDNTSKQFNAIGGIGAGSTFDGSFDGNGKSIKNLKSTVALFYKIANDGLIKDLTLDKTTSFTFTLSKVTLANGYRDAAAIVGATSSETNEVSNIVVNSDIFIVEENLYDNTTLPYTLNVGGIVARCYYGKIKNCLFSGNILFPSTFAFGSGKTATQFNGFQINVAGICGAVTNARGSLESSIFDGSIDFQTKITGYYHTIRVAGICGYFGNEVRTPLNGTSDKQIQNKGNITVNQAANAGANHTYLVAGIVAESLNTVSNMVNAGKVEVRASNNSKISKVRLSGIVGKLSAEKMVSDCENTGEVYLNLTSSSSVVDAFMAETTYAEGATYETVVLNCTNEGNVHKN